MTDFSESQPKKNWRTSVSTRTKWDRRNGKKLAKKVYVARIFQLDETGKWRETSKEFLRKMDADDHIRAIEQKVKAERGAERKTSGQKTFNDLADYYLKNYAIPAEYVGDRKTNGLRSLKPVLGYVKTLRDRFGDLQISEISHADIRAFRDARLKEPVVKKIREVVPIAPDRRTGRKRKQVIYTDRVSERKIASVNREMMTLRRMLKIAAELSWIERSPFTAGTSLISAANENMRERILSPAEEERLLKACNDRNDTAMTRIIVCLLDTGMRLGEVLSLTWGCVDLPAGKIHIKAKNTKTFKDKRVPISLRLDRELRAIQNEEDDNVRSDNLVFRGGSNIQRKWRRIRTEAGLEDLRLHDLRHTYGTWLNRQGFSQADIARLLGHQQVHTTYRYTNSDDDLLNRVKSLKS